MMGFARFVVAALALSVAMPGARADTAFAWRFGNGPDGEANAAIFASNALTTGSRAIDYHPVLTLSCRASGDPAWRQTIQVRDSIPGGTATAVTVRLDGGPAVQERWALGRRSRSLVLDGTAGLVRLLGAQKLRVAWRIGLFSGDGEAVFGLSGIRAAVAQIAARCGVPTPG